jgi:tRNA threonylcarbamoyladenosine biosynthesis protein TsaB
LLLAIDTSTGLASVALYAGGVIAERTWRSGQQHTVQVASQVQSMLTDQGLRAADLEAVAVATGPGSFSGVRVGVALAKTIACSLDLPLVGVPTLEAIAQEYAWTHLDIRPMIDGGRGQVATAVYRGTGVGVFEIEPACLADPDRLAPRDRATLCCGDVDDRLAGLLARTLGVDVTIVSPAGRPRRAGFLAEAAERRLAAGPPDDPSTLQPIYLRRPAVLDKLG